jgi:hypothetical protein
MAKASRTIGLAVASVLLAGCSASPWAGHWPAEARATAGPLPGIAISGGTACTVKGGPEAAEQMKADLQQLGTVDPAARDKLMAELLQTDPSLWPLAVQQARATAAYRRQANQRDGPAEASRCAAAEGAPGMPQASSPAAEPLAGGCAALPQAIPPDTIPPPATTDSPLLRADRAPVPPLLQPASGDPLPAGAGNVVAAAFERGVYSSAPIIGSPAAPAEAIRSTESKPETKQVLAAAVSRPGETAPLTVHSLAFCKAVQSYGCLTPFASGTFTPGQEVVLYAEVDNFSTESTPKGFHTSLHSSYQIVDSHGRRVAEPQSTTTDDYCRNPRRDFFIGYHLYLPKRLSPGKHTLHLTIEDLQGHKVGQSSLDFIVKGQK